MNILPQNLQKNLFYQQLDSQLLGCETINFCCFKKKNKKTKTHIYLNYCCCCLVTKWFSSVQFSCSVVSDSLKPHGLQHARPPCPSPTPVHHLKLMSIELVMPSTQTHIHRVGDAIQPSHPLSSPSPPAPNPSQHQSLFH